jgi:hypothetical protein
MSRTILASSLLLTILAMIETATGKVCQMPVLLRYLVLMKMMTAIQLYHLSDCLLLTLNPAHFFIILAK